MEAQRPSEGESVKPPLKTYMQLLEHRRKYEAHLEVWDLENGLHAMWFGCPHEFHATVNSKRVMQEVGGMLEYHHATVQCYPAQGMALQLKDAS